MTLMMPQGLPNLQAGTSSSAQNPVLSTGVSLEDFKKSRDAKKLAAWVDEQYQKAKGDRMAVQKQWYLNLSFYYGKHFYRLLPVPGQTPGAAKLYKTQAPPWKTRMAVNRSRQIIRRELSKLTSQKPNASVVPASSEDEDLFAAYAGEQVWESYYHSHKVHRDFRRAMWWMTICGTSFIKDYWDPTKADPSTPNAQGDICTGPVTPFHLFVPDLREEEIEDQPWIMNVYTKPVEWVQRFFGDKAPESLKADVVSINEIIDEAVMDLKGGHQSKPDAVLIKEFWAKPGVHQLLPEGGLLTVAGGQIIAGSMEGLPYQHGEYPFTKFDHIPTGKFYGESILTDIIPLQREYNRTRGQIIDNKNIMSQLQLLAPKGSVNPAKITNQPGQVIEYNPGFQPPQPMPLQPLPAYVLEELNRTLSDMDDLSGQHEVSKGQTPPGVTAATAISFLQEQDDSLLSTTYQSIEQGMEKIAKHVLSHAVQYWDVPRLVKATGTDGAFDALMLKGAELKKGTDIRMEGGSALPTSKAARQAFIMDMMKFNWIDPQEGLRLLEIGGVQKLYDQLKIDERQAQRENLRMKNLDPQLIAQQQEAFQASIPPEMLAMAQASGEQLPEAPPLVPVNNWDNHAVHIEFHNRFRKSQAFELLGPEIQAQFESHVKAHAMALNQAMMGAMESGMAPPDMAGGPMGSPPNMGGQEPPPENNGGANQFQPPGMEGMG